MMNEMKLRPEAKAIIVKFGTAYPTMEIAHKITPSNK